MLVHEFKMRPITPRNWMRFDQSTARLRDASTVPQYFDEQCLRQITGITSQERHRQFKMPSAATPNPRAGSTGPDNQLNYDQDVDDFLRDLPVNEDDLNNDTTAPAKDVDEEIKVRKKRAPAPKLDETRLLSDAGVPKLRKIAKTKLKFKGKGHEFSDISRLLNTYQLWLDDLYPRAKFRDALSMVEKLGHSKRMQVTRRAWVDGTKPSRREASVERLGDVEMSGALKGGANGDAPRAGSEVGDIFGERRQEGSTGGAERQQEDMPEDDELEALMSKSAPSTPHTTSRQQHKPRAPFEEDDDTEPDEDELDALMAEDAQVAPQASTVEQRRPRGPFEEEDAGPDEDELDALMAEEPHGGDKPSGHVPKDQAGQDAGSQDDFVDDEEAMASMGDLW